ncbi:hypothetical protein [Halpernia sp.]|uniref:hypothetical protein n=1 Tax=Halpernia sp. TaxID=2782209 RepID=UPI003A93F675
MKITNSQLGKFLFVFGIFAMSLSLILNHYLNLPEYIFTIILFTSVGIEFSGFLIIAVNGGFKRKNVD